MCGFSIFLRGAASSVHAFYLYFKGSARPVEYFEEIWILRRFPKKFPLVTIVAAQPSVTRDS